jgi:DNA polymerase-3 subunit gamma/tau
VVGVEGRLLQLGFSNPGLRDNFHGSNREETLREALREITGTEWKIDALVDPSAGTNAPGPMPSVAFPSSAPAPVAAPAAAAGPPPPSPSSQGAGGGPDQAPASSSAPPPFAQPAAPPPFAQAATPPEEDEPDPDDEDVDDAGPTARDLLVRELGATVLEEKSDAD